MSHHPFRNASYLTSAHTLRQLPEDVGAEAAFAGRSNAGKSSALNTICDQNALARTSKTPGRTQQLVVFPLDDNHRLIDLPGYGYAKVPMDLRDYWRGLIDGYLRSRESLKGIVLIMDVRHPLREFDQEMLTYAAASGREVHCLLSKADKLSRNEAGSTLLAVRKHIASVVPQATAQLFSSLKKTGVDEARAIIGGWLGY